MRTKELLHSFRANCTVGLAIQSSFHPLTAIPVHQETRETIRNGPARSSVISRCDARTRGCWNNDLCEIRRSCGWNEGDWPRARNPRGAWTSTRCRRWDTSDGREVNWALGMQFVLGCATAHSSRATWHAVNGSSVSAGRVQTIDTICTPGHGRARAEQGDTPATCIACGPAVSALAMSIKAQPQAQ